MYETWVGTGAPNEGLPCSSSRAGCEEGTGRCSIAIPANILTSGNWRFSVWAQNEISKGPWSAVRTFTYMPAVPPARVSLVSPSGEVGTSVLEYRWNMRANTDAYQLWVGGGGTTLLCKWYPMGRDVVQICGTSTGECAVVPPVAVPPGEWSFKVRARNAAGVSPWSAPMRFSYDD